MPSSSGNRNAGRQALVIQNAMTIAHARALKDALFGEASSAFDALDLSESPAIDVTGVQLLLLYQRRHPGAFPLAATQCSERVADGLRRLGLGALLVH
jgi:hypothetical protein